MRTIAPPRVLGLQGVDVDRMYPLASAKDREGGANRPICQRAPGASPITASNSNTQYATRPYCLRRHRLLMKLPCAQSRVGLAQVWCGSCVPRSKRKRLRECEFADMSGAPSVTNYRTAQRNVAHSDMSR